MSWHAHSGPRRKETGKFRSASTIGTGKTTGGQYRGWHFEFVTHQTGSGIRRTRYAVSISDTNRNRVAYLRDCSSVQQATDAAKQWIDETIGLTLPKQSPDDVGTIPALPSITTLAKQAQEK